MRQRNRGRGRGRGGLKPNRVESLEGEEAEQMRLAVEEAEQWFASLSPREQALTTAYAELLKLTGTQSLDVAYRNSNDLFALIEETTNG